MKKWISLLLSVILILSCINFTYALDENPEEQLAPVNEEYLDYYNGIDSYGLDEENERINYGIIPEPYVLPYIRKDEYQSRQMLPTSYNTGAVKEYVSSVKNQGSRGLCWSFAGLSNLESLILKQKNIVNNNDVNDFSENHASFALSNASGNVYGYNRTPDGGGNFYMNANYLTRDIMNGPVKETDDPYVSATGTSRSPEATAAINPDDYYLRKTIELPNLPSDYTNAEMYNRITEIKNLVSDYGSVYISFLMDSQYMNYNTYAYYTDDSSTNHAVDIVGWDDNYSKENFNSGLKPDINGAFVVKNSWGSSWGNNGYFYLSYQDTPIIKSVCAMADVTERSYYDNYYVHDEFGHNNNLGYGAGNTSAAVSKFSRKDLNGAECLKSIMTYNNAEYTYMKVYVSTTGDFADLQECTISNIGISGNNGYLIEKCGYVTLDFAEPVYLNSENFLVGIQYYNDDYGMCVPFGDPVSDGRNNTDKGFFAYSMNHMKSGSYTDCGVKYNANICIRAFTQNTENTWNFTDEKFNDLGTVRVNEVYENMKFNGTNSYPLYITGTSVYINGWSFNKALVMSGGNNLGKYSSDGTVEIDVDGATEIYIAAKANSDGNTQNVATAEMYIYDSNGNSIAPIGGSNSYSSGADVKKFVYSGTNATTLRIAPGSSSMKVFAISIKSVQAKDTTYIDKFWNIEKDISEYDGLDILSGVTYEDYRARNSYGTVYAEYVNLQGRGTNNSKSIKLYSPSNTDIYVTARTSGTMDLDSRVLCLVNKYGYVIGYSGDNYNPTLSSDILTYRFSYCSDDFNGEDLYIRSLDSGIDIYDIKIKTRQQDYTTIEESLNFDGSFFDNYLGIISEDVTINDTFKISATSDKTVRIFNRVRSLYDVTYNRCLTLIGQGASNYRNLKINVPGNTHIKIVAANSGDNTDIRELAVFDENGYIVAKRNISNQLQIVEFNYTGGENTLYIRSKEYGIYIYAVEVSSDDYNGSIPAYGANSLSYYQDQIVMANDNSVSSSAVQINEISNLEEENELAVNNEKEDNELAVDDKEEDSTVNYDKNFPDEYSGEVDAEII